MSRWTLKTRVLVSFLLAGLLPMLVMAVYARYNAATALEETAYRTFEGLRSSKQAEITRYFQTIQDQVLTLSHDVMVVEAAKEFKSAFWNVIEDNKLKKSDLRQMREGVWKYYSEQFGQEYKKQTNGDYDIGAALKKLSNTEIALQYYYIQNNENPLGSKHKLDRASDGSRYSELHAKYHPSIREFLEKFGYYDVFIVDAETGHVVYSVFKELDYTTSLLTGPYKDTNFAEAFRRARDLDNKTDSVLVDFQQYSPSYEAPASFIASPIWEGDQKIAVLLFQMPIDRINLVMGSRSGLGDTGESYLVGADQHMRSNSLLEPEKLSVVASFRAREQGKVNSPSIEAAFRGETAAKVSTNYRGDAVLASYQPVEILGLKWALLVEMSEAEVFAALSSLNWAIMVLVVCSAVLSAVWAFLFAKDLGGQVSRVSGQLANAVAAISRMAQSLSGESVKLSEAGNEQASSLQETAASIDEISAMVERNSDSASNAANLSKASDEAARLGKQRVGQMVESIHSISKKQEELNQHLDENNKKMEEIVAIISQIGEKTKVINDIVFQTKLLSFNASVEAARAGEHGKGFAVVAEEVGNLASMSGKAADEISSMLDSSTQYVRKIMSETKDRLALLSAESRSSVESGQKVARECGQALDQILSQVAAVNEKVQEIATASAEQSTGVREVSVAMSQLDQVTQQNSVIAQDAAVLSKDMTQEVKNLERIAGDVRSIVEGSAQVSQNRADALPLVGATSNLRDLTAKKREKAAGAKGQREMGSVSPLKAEVVGKASVVATPRPAAAKVVGLSSSEVPSADDQRFEDI